MFLSRVQLFIATITIYIVLPILILISLLILGEGTLIDCIVYSLLAGSFLFFLFKAAAWEFTNYYIRYAIVFIFFVITFRNIFFISREMKNIYELSLFTDVLVLIPFLLVMYLNIGIIRGSLKPKNCIQLIFPLKNGKYIVTDGGDGNISSFINYHTKAQIHNKAKNSMSMRYATDIAKINKFGSTVKNVLVKENKEYVIFQEKVYSPCDAMVLEVVDGIEDNIPFGGKYPYNVGNCVVLKMGNYYIVMGHLEKKSIIVKEGDRVKCGQLLGEIGNSGLTPRPHLHMQVSECEDGNYWKGCGIPIFFNDLVFPIKNNLIKV